MTPMDRVRAELLRRQMSLSEFAAQLGVRGQDINNWTKRGIPRGKQQAVADALGWTLDHLLIGRPLPPSLLLTTADHGLHVHEPRGAYTSRQLLDLIDQLTTSQRRELHEWLDKRTRQNREILDELLPEQSRHRE